MSKTSEFGSAIDSEHLSELTEEEVATTMLLTLICILNIIFSWNRALRKDEHICKDSCTGTLSF